MGKKKFYAVRAGRIPEIYQTSNGLDNNQIDFLNDLYNFYNRIRHPYSHWSQNSIDVQVITEMSVARDLIIEGLKLIDKYYIMC